MMHHNTNIACAPNIVLPCHAGKSRFIHLPRHLIVIFALALISTCVAAEVQFISTTPENTSVPENSPIPGDSTYWNWLPKEGNGGIFESTGDPERNAPPLVMWIDGLEAKTDYEVFGYFWAPGFSEENKNPKPHHWPARFGLGMASLTTFGGKHSERIPWIISPGAKISEVHGVSATVEEDKPLDLGDSKLTTANGDTRLIRARIGVSRTDAEGRLPVFIDDFPDSIHCGKTRIDGVAVRKAAKDSKPSAGGGGTQALHFALRARDRLSAEREIAAGVDVNALDADSLSPLFHPALFGDLEMVKVLLKAGADPNIEGQSILVLTAAASTGDAEMVKLLLEAGADVPTGKIEPVPWMADDIDQSHLHPAIAAIRIGSLATLKRILEKCPDLDLEALGLKYDEENRHENYSTSLFLVEEAMAMEHDELAAFLINRGCTLREKRFDLMTRSVTEGELLAKSREALLRRGESPVDLIDQDYHFGTQFYSVKPWDALSAAVRVGNVRLSQRFLPLAAEVNETQQLCLLALARWSGEPVILKMLNEQFPDLNSHWKSEKTTSPENHQDESLRLLLPRTKPIPVRPASDDGEWTLAVVSAPEASGQAAMIEVTAADVNGWKVVDRQEVETTLREKQIGNVWGNGEYRLAELGDSMSADLILLASLIESPGIKLLRFEAVDVATGLAVLREHVEHDAFDPEKSVKPLLDRVRSAFLTTREGGRPKAVTMLPFSVSDKIANAESRADLFRSAIHAEVDASPGVMAVGMDQIEVIAAEQTLGVKDGFWAAAFTLEGGVSSLEDDRISLTLRLRSLDDGENETLDMTEEGRIDQIPALAARAWSKLADSELFGGQEARKIKPNDKQANAEAERLLREAEWLTKSEMASDALPLLERAELLGAEPERLVSTHLQALLLKASLTKARKSIDNQIVEHVPGLAYQDRLFLQLNSAKKLLDKAAYYQSRFGATSVHWKSSDFWDILRYLSFFRASIPKVLPNWVSQEKVRDFGSQLDSYSAEFFRIRALMKRPTLGLSSKPFTVSHTAAMLRRNPELLKGWVTMLLASSSFDMDYDTRHNSMFSEFFGMSIMNRSDFSRREESQSYGKTSLLANELVQTMDQYRGKCRDLRLAEIGFILSKDDERATAARKYAMQVAKLNRRDYYSLPFWMYDYRSSYFGTSVLLDSKTRSAIQRDEESMLASLVQEPRGNLDFTARTDYQAVIRVLVGLEERSVGEVNRYIKVNSTWGKFDSLAEVAAKASNPRADLDRLKGGVFLWERIFGRPIYDELSKKWDRLYLPDEDEKSDNGLEARLLTDLRAIDNFRPGDFILPMVDSKRRDKVWVYYRPYEKEGLQRDGDNYPRPHLRQPWLVGVDCASGKIVTSVNLSQAPTLDPGDSAVNSMERMEEIDAFMVQTDETILTHVTWSGMDHNNAKRKKATVLIGKEDGEIVPLDPPTLVTAGDDLAAHYFQSTGAVAIGDEFFCLEFAGDPDSRRRHVSRDPFNINRISSTGEVSRITEYGRRPELTPFDPADRAPKMILRDGNQLLVIHDDDYVGRYNPKDKTWKMDDKPSKEQHKFLLNKGGKEYRNLIFPQHVLVGVGQRPRLFVDHEKNFPDKLAIKLSNGKSFRVPVELEFPDDFEDQIIFADLVKRREKSGINGYRFYGVGYDTYANRKDADIYRIVVIGQTDKDLILALQIGSGFPWLVGKRAGDYLPLLWALPKEQIFTAATPHIERLTK